MVFVVVVEFVCFECIGGCFGWDGCVLYDVVVEEYFYFDGWVFV